MFLLPNILTGKLRKKRGKQNYRSVLRYVCLYELKQKAAFQILPDKLRKGSLLQRRQALREKLNLEQFESDSDGPDSRQQEQSTAKPSTVSVHENGQYTSVVTVEPFSMHSDRSVASTLLPVSSL